MRQYILMIIMIGIAFSLNAQTEVHIDENKKGFRYEGIGALSAGASSRLLIDYPEPYRSDILDFLFKPRFGASLQHFKFEIGGDINSTCGTEPAHARDREEMHNPQRAYFERGYEWWMAKEAKKRNKKILFDALQWGAPGWFEGGFYSRDNADFIVSYIKGMKRYHDIDIIYCGLWNEKHVPEPSRDYVVNMLRPALDRNGLGKVTIVANDMYCNSPEHHKPWSYAEELLKDDELRQAVGILGYHYLDVEATPEVKKLNMTVWESEASILNGDWEKALRFAHNTNRNYIRSKAVKTIIWNPIASYFPNVSWPNVGIMQADMPWCGYYKVRPAVWAIAHTTQFAEPGWFYMDSGCGETVSGTSYITLKHPRKDDYSIVLVSGNSEEEIAFRLSIPKNQTFHIWKSDKKEQFIKISELKIADSRLTLSAEPNSIYTITTTSGQTKGIPAHVIPKEAAFPIIYTEDFESDGNSPVTPRWLSDQGGSFEVVKLENGNKVLRQQITGSLICWDPWGKNNPEPFTEAGSVNAGNYVISADVLIGEKGKARLFGCVTWFESNTAPHGIGYEIAESGNWALLINQQVVAEGKTNLDPVSWNRLSLECGNVQIKIKLNEQILTTIPADKKFTKGLFGIGSDWNHVCFDNLEVKPM